MARLERRLGRLRGALPRAGAGAADRAGFDPGRLDPTEQWELDGLLGLVAPLPGEPAARGWTAAEAARAGVLLARADPGAG